MCERITAQPQELIYSLRMLVSVPEISAQFRILTLVARNIVQSQSIMPSTWIYCCERIAAQYQELK